MEIVLGVTWFRAFFLLGITCMQTSFAFLIVCTATSSQLGQACTPTLTSDCILIPGSSIGRVCATAAGWILLANTSSASCANCYNSEVGRLLLKTLLECSTVWTNPGSFFLLQSSPFTLTSGWNSSGILHIRRIRSSRSFPRKNGGNSLWLQFSGQLNAKLCSDICSRLKTVFFEMLAAKNRILRGIPLRSSTLHLLRPFLSQEGILRELEKTNTVAVCVGTRSSHAASRHCARVSVLSMTYTKPHPQ